LSVLPFDVLKADRLSLKQASVLVLIASLVLAAILRTNLSKIRESIDLAPASGTGPADLPPQFAYTLLYEAELDIVFRNANVANQDVLKNYETFERAWAAVAGTRPVRVRWVGELLNAGDSKVSSVRKQFKVVTINKQNFEDEWKPVLRKMEEAILCGNRTGRIQLPERSEFIEPVDAIGP